MTNRELVACPGCRVANNASAKFCYTCGRRLGFGVRSENEIRASIVELNRHTFVVGDRSLKPLLLSDIELMTYVLRWTIGEETIRPKDMLESSIATDGKVRSVNDSQM